MLASLCADQFLHLIHYFNHFIIKYNNDNDNADNDKIILDFKTIHVYM